ncbi:MAG TPA: BatD family protein, partial [Elusimicrobiota bacterium]|nr:BatD family protein [Elusimicrobiota bacterium]
VRPSASGTGPVQSPGSAAAPSAPAEGPAPKARPGAPDIFVTAEVDNPRPYVNQQVIFTVRLHTAVTILGNPEWIPPAFNGLLSEDLPPGGHGQETSHGRSYFVSELKMAFFPTQPGKLTIAPGAIRCQIQEEMNIDPFAPDFFQRFFASGQMQAQTRELRTKPVELDVQALPAGKPAGFGGAVGRYKLRAEVDRKQAKAGEAVNLSVTVEGSGNLKALGDLPMPELKAFRVYDTVTALNQVKDARGVHGSKVYKTVLVPQASGPVRIPPIALSFFDPERKEYATTQSDPIDLQIAPGDATAAAPNYVAPGGRPAAQITTVNEDIRYAHTRARDAELSRAAEAWAGLGWVHAVPLALLLASLGWAGYVERLSQNPAALRFREALPKAQGRVREARGFLAQEPQRAAGLLYDALTAFLAAKLDCASAGLTRRDAERLLRQRFPKLPDGHLQRMRALWEELEALRFAPAGQHAADGHLPEGLLELFRALEEDLK